MRNGISGTNVKRKEAIKGVYCTWIRETQKMGVGNNNKKNVYLRRSESVPTLFPSTARSDVRIYSSIWSSHLFFILASRTSPLSSPFPWLLVASARDIPQGLDPVGRCQDMNATRNSFFNFSKPPDARRVSCKHYYTRIPLSFFFHFFFSFWDREGWQGPTVAGNSCVCDESIGGFVQRWWFNARCRTLR